DRVIRLGVDETAFLAATAYRSTCFVTGIVDLTGRVARLLDVVEGRSGKALCDWVSGRAQAWRDAIGVAALDPLLRLRAIHLPAGRDPGARRLPRQPARLRRRRRRAPPRPARVHRTPRPQTRPLFRIRRLLRRRADRLSELAWQRLLIGLELG